MPSDPAQEPPPRNGIPAVSPCVLWRNISWRGGFHFHYSLHMSSLSFRTIEGEGQSIIRFDRP
jgi:hypothetical protein